jgi:hypothetical protein
MPFRPRLLLLARWLWPVVFAPLLLLPPYHPTVAAFLLIPAVVLYAAPMVRMMVRMWKRYDLGDPLRKYLD